MGWNLKNTNIQPPTRITIQFQTTMITNFLEWCLVQLAPWSPIRDHAAGIYAYTPPHWAHGLIMCKCPVKHKFCSMIDELHNMGPLFGKDRPKPLECYILCKQAWRIYCVSTWGICKSYYTLWWRKGNIKRSIRWPQCFLKDALCTSSYHTNSNIRSSSCPKNEFQLNYSYEANKVKNQSWYKLLVYFLNLP